jgi:very-short-patch-repair endonuclease
LPLKVVVELIGSAHDSDDAKAYDASRTRFLQEAGFRVIEFSNEEVLGDPRSVEATLRSTLTPAPPPQGEGASAAAEEPPPMREGSSTP